jgi:hypothetical protein
MIAALYVVRVGEKLCSNIPRLLHALAERNMRAWVADREAVGIRFSTNAYLERDSQRANQEDRVSESSISYWVERLN